MPQTARIGIYYFQIEKLVVLHLHEGSDKGRTTDREVKKKAQRV